MEGRIERERKEETEIKRNVVVAILHLAINNY